MPLMTWDENYSVKIKSIDEQHKMLFTWVNNLYDAISNGDSDQELERCLNYLCQYAQYHFMHEEKLMREHGYPDYVNHKVLHDVFRRKVEDFRVQVRSGHEKITTALMDFLKDWLCNHVLIIDKNYSSHLTGKGVS